MKRILRNSIFGLLMSLLSIAIVIAQTNCPELVTEALQAVDASCAATGRNEACYGYDQVEASFLSTVADDFFTSPADLAAVAEIETIRTAPLNTETGTWGVAVMNLQADLPSTIPGQTVTFVLLGDVELENAVAPEDAFVPSEGIEVTINSAAGANVRSGPSQNFNVVGGLRDGEIVTADGLSEDGTWLRVAYRDRPAWISMTVIDDNNPALRDLPTLTADLRTPMQAFYLRTGIGQPECAEAPSDSLLVQGPENIEITIDVNGAAIQLGSTGVLNIVYDENGNPFLNVSVFDGIFKIGDVEIRRGQHSLVCLGDENSRGLDGEDNDLVVTCDPTPPEAFEEDWCNLENIPAELLNYDLDVPCPGETPPPTGGGGDGGGGATDSQITGVNCNNFGLVSPLFPVDAGTHTFEWTAVTGDNITYQLVFYNYEGTEVESFFTPNTSHTLNLGAETSTGGTFFWEVRAFQNGVYACVTFRSPALTRTADADVGGSSGSFNASKLCSGSQNATISWSGAPSGDVTIVWYEYGSMMFSTTGSGESGSKGISNSYSNIESINVSSGGQIIYLGNCP
jgi:hypothetical protein